MHIFHKKIIAGPNGVTTIPIDHPSAGHVTGHVAGQLTPSADRLPGLSAPPSGSTGKHSPARRVWIESSFVSGGKGEQLPTNFGNVNDDDDDVNDELDDDEMIIGEANYSDGQIRKETRRRRRWQLHKCSYIYYL